MKKWRNLLYVINGEYQFDTAPKLRLLLLILTTIHALLIGVFMCLHIWMMVNMNIISLVVYLFAYFTRIRDNYKNLTVLLYAEILIHTMLAVISIGWESGFYLYIFGMVPTAYYMAYNSKVLQQRKLNAWALVLVSVIVFFVLKGVSSVTEPLHEVQKNYELLLYILNALITFVVVVYIMILFATQVNISEHILQTRNRKLYNLANTDPLTELSNRRGMQKRLESAIHDAVENGSTFCLILSDIDDFKVMNDTYGHECGDFVLISIAETLKKQVRDNDFVCRWGGEEILILLNNCSVNLGSSVAEKLRSVIETTGLMYNGVIINFTMTFGVQEYVPGSTAEEVIRYADMKLYHGKKGGKNCVVSQLEAYYNRNEDNT